MRQLNRVNQYARVWQQSAGEMQHLSVGELAACCYCSERHARSLLRLWQQSQWVEWLAEPGRGKRGKLRFLTSPDALRRQLIRQHLDLGQPHSAMQLSQLDPEQLTHLLQPLMGGHWQNDAPTLRIPYYRPLENWHPLQLTGRAEQHMAMQVFSGLTRFNQQRVEGDLAHHWHISEDGVMWDFYLRPQLFWHNGEQVLGEQLLQGLHQLLNDKLAHPLFASVQSITLPHPACLRFQLSKPDYWLASRLASVPALLPHPENATQGCGPWQLARFEPELVRLESHPRYHLQHPLMQALEYWITPSLFAPELGTSCRHPVQIAIGQAEELPQLRPVEESVSLGFCYLAIQHHRLTPLQALSIMSLIHRNALISHLDVDEGLITPSSHVLPGWASPVWSAIEEAVLPAKLTLYYHLPVELHAMANSLKQTLLEQGCELTLCFHPQKSWRGCDGLSEADLVMGDRLIGEAPEYTLESWLRSDTLWTAMLSPRRYSHLQHSLDTIQNEPLEERRFSALAETYLALMQGGHLMPLFNYRYQVSAPPGVQGIHLNARGWFDFSRAWIPPPLG
ncbi:peptide ABC transporter substrate-binding protein [Enterobacterales bacterium CwR94]|nr:peptide ABC transporter substrate-binding protein [Enterobacterales bacterium CwR94]